MKLLFYGGWKSPRFLAGAPEPELKIAFLTLFDLIMAELLITELLLVPFPPPERALL